MVEIAEQQTAADTIKATVNYLLESGEMPYVYTGGPGSLDVRTGRRRPARSRDPERTPPCRWFRVGARRLPFRASRHRDGRFFRRGRNSPDLLPGDGSAGESRDRRVSRRRVRPHPAHGRRSSTRVAQDPRGGPPRAQRLHRMVRAAAGARPAAARGRRTAARDASPSSRSGGRFATRSRAFHWRSATPAASRPRTWWSRSAATPTASARPTPSATTPSTVGTGCRACGAKRRWCSRSTIPTGAAAPAGLLTPPSRIRPRRSTPARARASRSARWRSFEIGMLLAGSGAGAHCAIIRVVVVEWRLRCRPHGELHRPFT